MGSPPLRIAAVVVAGILAGLAALPARADEQAATRAATAFLDAVGRGDADAVCAMFTPTALDRLGGAEKCRRLYGEQPDNSDFDAMRILQDALRAAEKSAVRRRGKFVTASFKVGALARDMERFDEDLTVRLGTGPRAAAGQLSTTVVLDRRTNARRVVLYAESDDGSIYRLSAAMLGRPDYEEVAQGVAEKDPGPSNEGTFAFQLGEVTAASGGRMFVAAKLMYTEDDETYTLDALIELAAASDGYRVADLYYSLVSSASGD